MAATSVSGVGPGSAEGKHKGPGNNRAVFQPLQSAHVVAAGSGTLSGANPGVLTVTFGAPLPEAAANYVVMLTDTTTAGGGVIAVSAKTDSSSKFASFDVKGVTSHTFDYAVIRKGVI